MMSVDFTKPIYARDGTRQKIVSRSKDEDGNVIYTLVKDGKGKRKDVTACGVDGRSITSGHRIAANHVDDFKRPLVRSNAATGKWVRSKSVHGLQPGDEIFFFNGFNKIPSFSKGKYLGFNSQKSKHNTTHNILVADKVLNAISTRIFVKEDVLAFRDRINKEIAEQLN